MPADIILNGDDLQIVGENIGFTKTDGSKATVRIDPANGNIGLGDHNTDGDLLIYSKTGKRSVEISAEKNKKRDDRTIYINGQDPSIEIKHFKKNSSGVFPKITFTPTQIECKVNRGLPKFKLSSQGAVFTAPVAVMMGSAVTISRDITIRAKARDGSQKTVNVHRDIVRLKQQVAELKQQVAELRRRL